MSRRRWLAAIYGIALVVSTIVRIANPHSEPLVGKQLLKLSSGVRIAYYDSGAGSAQQVLLLVHGSPGSSDVVRGLAELMRDEYRVIAPDLPGFGASTHDLPDYSFRAHATYLAELLDRLHLRRVHAAGFSMGGGVVLSLLDVAPQHVCSLDMISAIGVQEHELTGSYWANHALHGVQLALLWGLKYGAPHFGALDGEGLNVEYARNFFDSDQRPLRQVIASYRGPMLIVHGKNDHNIPLAAALEHHRLAPQSQLVLFDEDHFMIFQKPQLVVGPVKEFLLGIRNSCGE